MENKREIKKENVFKKILIIILFIALFAVFLCGFGYCTYICLMSEEENNMREISNINVSSLLDFNETFEYGSSLSYDELLNKVLNLDNLKEDTNVQLFINDQEFIKNTVYKFDAVGNYSIKVYLSYDYIIMNKIHRLIDVTKDFEIKVNDTKLPIISGVSNKEITVGDNINLLDGISAKDEIDGDLEVSYSGSVDTNKVGEYVIKASATDKNGNVSEQEFKVVVKEKPTVSTATSTKTSSSNKTSNKTSNSASSNKGNSNSSSSSKNDASTKAGRLQIATAEAKKIVSQIIKPGMSDYDKAYAIFKYLTNNVATQHNQSNEAYKTNYGNEAYAALVLKKAACSGFCKAVTLMCNSAGLKSKHVNANQWSHQWNTVLVNGEWIILDAQGRIFGGTVHPLEY